MQEGIFEEDSLFTKKSSFEMFEEAYEEYFVIEKIFDLIDNEVEYLISALKDIRRADSRREILRLLSDKSFEQFKSIATALRTYLYSSEEEESKDKTRCIKIGKIMQCWIVLGSVIETALQYLLAVYIDEYEKENFGKWVNFDFNETKKQFLTLINKMKESGVISQDEKDKLKKSTSKFLKTKEESKAIETLMLGELNSFFCEHVWGDNNKDEMYRMINNIREKRNCIHSFREREIGNEKELLKSLIEAAHIIQSISSHFPDVSDALSYMREFENERHY